MFYSGTQIDNRNVRKDEFNFILNRWVEQKKIHRIRWPNVEKQFRTSRRDKRFFQQNKNYTLMVIFIVARRWLSYIAIVTRNRQLFFFRLKQIIFLVSYSNLVHEIMSSVKNNCKLVEIEKTRTKSSKTFKNINNKKKKSYD